MFGLDPKTAIRYAENARLLLGPQLRSKPPGFGRQKTARPAARTPHSLLGMDTSSGEDLVRAGYDALSHRYRGDDDSAEEYGPWLADLQTHLPGLEVTVQQFVPEGNSGHALFWARRPPRPPSSP